MTHLIEFSPFLIAMAALIAASAFFSCSEAALFYLGRRDRRQLQAGGSAGRIALELLDKPQRLLTAILFWNLSVNIMYFALVSIVGLQLEQRHTSTEAGIFALTALIVLILFSEMLPKNIAVLRPRVMARLVSVPLAAAVRLLDPVLPVLHAANSISRRVLFPSTSPEPYLELADLERAITLSTSDRTLLEQEHTVLRNIVSMSELHVEELMRPRTQFLSFQPPVKLADLEGRLTPSGYMLITEANSEEIAGAIPLRYLSDLPTEHLEQFAEPVIYIPWCANVGQILDEMHRRDREVAAVINEYGETIGIVTYDDLLETLFADQERLGGRKPSKTSIVRVEEGKWHASGMVSLQRLARSLEDALPESRGVTIAGLLQEQLQRLPDRGDSVQWGGYLFRVLDVPKQGPLHVEIHRAAEEASP